MSIQIGSIVKFNGCFCAAEVISINGKMAVVDYLGEYINKRLTSLTEYVYVGPYIDEQERAHMDALNNTKRGDVVYSIIDANGTGGNYVWDSIKRDCVRSNELTAI